MTTSVVYLVAAYVLVWAFAFGYMIWMAGRQERLRREVEALRKALEVMGGPRAAGR